MGLGKVAMRLVGYNYDLRSLSLMHETYLQGLETGMEMLLHEGEEAGGVFSCCLEVTVSGQMEILHAGDGYYFSSFQPRRFRNVGDQSCVLVSANNPASL